MFKKSELKNPRLVHLITDEKFPDSAYELFEAVLPGQNEFILPGKKKTIKNLKKINPIRVGKYDYLKPSFVEFINEYDALLVHGMNSFSIRVINRCRPGLKVFWIGMGFDYYDLIFKSKEAMLKPHTKAVARDLNVLKERNSGDVLKSGKKAIKKLLKWDSLDKKKQFLNRVDYFCPVLESEFYSVLGVMNGWSPKYVDWNYGNSTDLVDGKFGEKFELGDNILLGNSAAQTNNHFDSMYLLKKYESFFSYKAKIIAPLSYGDMVYGAKVCEKGAELFGDRFIPLTDMLSSDSYRKILESCGYVVMNHVRQQAGNNIAQALFMGARVFLDKTNPFYEEYESKGAAINSFSDIETSPKLLGSPLSDEEKAVNKMLLKQLRGRDVAISKTRNLINEIVEA